MVVTNLEYYLCVLVSRTPLFTVETLLSAPEIVLHPHANELCKIMMVAMREVVDRLAPPHLPSVPLYPLSPAPPL